MSSEEKKDRNIGLLVSLGIHGVLILLFIFIMAWRAPDPPLPEYGIELNFGLEQAGFGDVEPETPAEEPSELESLQESQPEESQQQEEVVEEQPAASAQEEVDSQQEDSPVEAKPAETPKPISEPKPEVKETPKPERPTEKPVTEPKPKPEKPKVDQTQLYSGGKSQGNTEGKGNAGNPEGSVDAESLMGKPGGGGGGPSLDLFGWNWDSVPKPNDQSSENGKIVFEIKVDDRGEVIGVRTLERTVSPTVEQIYKRSVEKLTFSPTSNSSPAPVSTGKITFIIRSK